MAIDKYHAIDPKSVGYRTHAAQKEMSKNLKFLLQQMSSVRAHQHVVPTDLLDAGFAHALMYG